MMRIGSNRYIKRVIQETDFFYLLFNHQFMSVVESGHNYDLYIYDLRFYRANIIIFKDKIVYKIVCSTPIGNKEIFGIPIHLTPYHRATACRTKIKGGILDPNFRSKITVR